MPRDVTVVMARFEDLVAIGLTTLIDADPHLTLLANRVEPADLEKALAASAPDVAVLNFGSAPGPEVFRLHHAFPQTHLVVLANRPTIAECSQMLSFGATACLSKETEGRDVINAIHLASRGMHVLPRSSAPRHTGWERAAELLTPREAEVLELLQDGASNAQIAHHLTIGTETVRTHARNIYRKLGVGSRRELSRLGRGRSRA